MSDFIWISFAQLKFVDVGRMFAHIVFDKKPIRLDDYKPCATNFLSTSNSFTLFNFVVHHWCIFSI